MRRTDPAWGADQRALRADADTFHFTNCTPQVGFFNMGSAPRNTPNSGGGRLWRALEDYVLDKAVEEDKRVSVFTGPILDDQKDPLWRDHIVDGFRVPMRFWKIVLWPDGGSLRATAMIADQSALIEVMPEAIERGEAFVDTSAVKDFVTTVTEVERLTGLTFGQNVRDADVRSGESKDGGRARTRLLQVSTFGEINLAPHPRRQRQRGLVHKRSGRRS